MIVILDQRRLTHTRTCKRHPTYGLHLLQNGGSVQFFRTVDTDLPKLCTAQLRRHHRSEYRRSTGDRDSLSFYQFVYQHPDGTMFADTFGDDQWDSPKSTMVDPLTYASADLEYLGTTFADEPTTFGTTMPTPDGQGRINITVLLGKICSADT